MRATYRRYLADTRDNEGGGFLAELEPEREFKWFSDGLNPPTFVITDGNGTAIEESC